MNIAQEIGFLENEISEIEPVIRKIIKDNKGKILSIDTPQKIIQEYPDKLYAIKSNQMSGLLKELRNNAKIKSAFSFGEYHHISYSESHSGNPLDASFLSEKYDDNIEIKSIDATVEDCFIHLMSKEEVYE